MRINTEDNPLSAAAMPLASGHNDSLPLRKKAPPGKFGKTHALQSGGKKSGIAGAFLSSSYFIRL
jgi:hypothetical protein